MLGLRVSSVRFCNPPTVATGSELLISSLGPPFYCYCSGHARLCGSPGEETKARFGDGRQVRSTRLVVDVSPVGRSTVMPLLVCDASQSEEGISCDTFPGRSRSIRKLNCSFDSGSAIGQGGKPPVASRLAKWGREGLGAAAGTAGTMEGQPGGKQAGGVHCTPYTV